MTLVGLLGPPDDEELRFLDRRLRHRGARTWSVDLADPAVHLTLDRTGVRCDGRALLDMDAAYVRRVLPRLPRPLRYDTPGGDESAAEWAHWRAPAAAALQRARARLVLALTALEQLARHRPVVNPPLTQELHRLKPWMLHRLRGAGLPLPETAAGTDPDALQALAGALSGRGAQTVAKPLAGIYKTVLRDERQAAAHPWSRRPALVQRRVQGATVRCYVLRGELLAAARIVHGGTVDSSVSQTGVASIPAPPPALREAAEGTARALGLAFCGMDLMEEVADERYLVVDCNLSPMFVAFGALTGCDVAGHLADLLIERARGGSDERPAVLDLVDDAKRLLAGDADLLRLVGGAASTSDPSEAP